MPTKSDTLSMKTYYKRIVFSKQESYCSLKRLKKERFLSLANKLIKNTTDPRNAKEY